MNATARRRIIEIKIERLPDDDPDTSYLEQPGFEDRLKAYRNAQFEFMGVRAKATVTLAGFTQTITSPGLWGIEGDSSEDYLRAVEKEEMTILRAELRTMGFSVRAIKDATP